MLKIFSRKKDEKPEESTPPFYTSFKPIKVVRFHEILEKGNYSLLYIDEKGEKDLTEVWYEIYDEYCRAAKVDNKNIRLISLIEKLREKHDSISNLLILLTDEFPEVREAAKEALKTKGYILREDQPLKQEYARLKSQLNVLQTKIKIEEKKLPKEENKQAISLMKQAVILETQFPGRDMDIHSLTMEKWLAYWELANEKALAQRALNQKNKR